MRFSTTATIGLLLVVTLAGASPVLADHHAGHQVEEGRFLLGIGPVGIGNFDGSGLQAVEDATGYDGVNYDRFGVAPGTTGGTYEFEATETVGGTYWFYLAFYDSSGTVIVESFSLGEPNTAITGDIPGNAAEIEVYLMAGADVGWLYTGTT